MHDHRRATAHRRDDDRRDRHRHERASPPPGTSPPGPGNAPATTSRPASAAPAGPARGPSTSMRAQGRRDGRDPHQRQLPAALIPAQQVPRLGHSRALGAVKHSMLCACWHMLSTGEIYTDLGGDYFARRDPERHDQAPRRPARTPRPQRHAAGGGCVGLRRIFPLAARDGIQALFIDGDSGQRIPANRTARADPRRLPPSRQTARLRARTRLWGA